jgi:tRNA A37 methylthiotransferase MiaB
MPEKHNENFYEDENKAAANIGRDDVPSEDPEKRQEFLQQRQGDWDYQDNQERLQADADWLHKQLKERGIMDDYPMVWRYVESGGMPSTKEDKIAFPKIKEVDDEGMKEKPESKPE